VELPGGAAFAAAKRRAARVMRAPAFGLVAIAPLVFLGAAGGSSPTPWNAVSDADVTTMAAVAASDGPTPMVVAARRAPDPFRVANASISAPPPAFVMNSVGSLRIPAMALNAYRNAEQMMASAYPGCGISWNLLAGIGRIESMHANGGATDARGNPAQPILGPTLDGTLAGNEVIVQNVQAGRVTYARAMGPMQFLPGTWARYASDGDGDGKADVQNLYDSTLAAARYLCSGNLNLRDRNQVLTAILRYNNSAAYAQNVLGWAAAYATGVVPVDLPPISGSAPIGDGHLDANPEGLGPGMPLNAAGLPMGDPMALASIFQLGRWDEAGQMTAPTAGPLPGPSAGTPQTMMQDCRVFCLAQAPEAPPPAFPPSPFAAPAEPQAAVTGPEAPPLAPTPGPAQEPPALGPAPGPAG
jgi:membrane-bound lytic murein transglycosylase B